MQTCHAASAHAYPDGVDASHMSCMTQTCILGHSPQIFVWLNAALLKQTALPELLSKRLPESFQMGEQLLATTSLNLSRRLKSRLRPQLRRSNLLEPITQKQLQSAHQPSSQSMVSAEDAFPSQVTKQPGMACIVETCPERLVSTVWITHVQLVRHDIDCWHISCLDLSGKHSAESLHHIASIVIICHPLQVIAMQCA